MKKLFTNTISIILLVFYLTGFCGLNLLKHSCFTCHQHDFHVIYDLDHCGDEMHVCEADPRPHRVQAHEEPSHAHYVAIPCCTLELIYLKNYPKIPLNQVVKSSLIPSLDLHIVSGLQLCNFIDASKKVSSDYLQRITDPPEISIQKLCCYRC